MRRLATPIVAAAVFASATPSAYASEWVRVAYDDAGSAGAQPHLTTGTNWRFEGPADVDEALRTVAFGERVTFAYAGMNPAAPYRAILRFCSDGPREMRVWVGATVAFESVALGAGSVEVREIDLSPVAYAPGSLVLAVERVQGPNAVVADIEILSTDPTPLGVRRLPDVPPPRLTPRPERVLGGPATHLDLNGRWRFHPAPPGDFAEGKPSGSGWSDITVPGEWAMQGFEVTRETPAAYVRTFRIGSKPAGERWKLRFSAVYSLCRAWVNGVAVGEHEGGFVPFEFDVTEALRPGENTLAVSVQSESMLDRLSCGSQYAAHTLGGITRKVELFAVPEVHVADLAIETRLDLMARDAVLTARVAIRNESNQASVGRAQFTIEPVGRSTRVDAASAAVAWSGLAPGETRVGPVRIPVRSPSLWDHEHPNLYRLMVRLSGPQGATELVSETFGFREVRRDGTQVLLNGQPIKLRGVCRHEVHPLLGRALTPELWHRDAELYRAGNCNFIRTSHYPPAEEFIAECDRLGLLVELEAPLCWVGHGASSAYTSIPMEDEVFVRLAQANLDTVYGYRNHPSVILRSLANESAWSPLWARVHALVREADPTRLTTFHDQCWGGYNNQGSSEMPVGIIHYPGPGGPAQTEAETRPIQFGEYCHLNSYNRRELVTDPGLRDVWGPGLAAMWEAMWAAPACLGGSIWAAMDDTFFLPSGETVGYGTWGPLDGWRRPKPEYWHMKKAYSPLRLREQVIPLPRAGEPVLLTVENRFAFTDLAEVGFEWTVGERHGRARARGAPGETGRLRIPVGAAKPGELLTLRAFSPLGFEIDVWQVALGEDPRLSPPEPASVAGAPRLDEASGEYVVRGTGYVVTVDGQTGAVRAIGLAGRPALTSMPSLMLLPANGDDVCGVQMSGVEPDIPIFSDTCHNWRAKSVSARETAEGIEVRIVGAYDEAAGSFVLRFAQGSVIELGYEFTVTEPGRCDPRQIGVVFDLPAGADTLSWRRRAEWSFYPNDHIGRPQGTARALVDPRTLCGLAGPRSEPNWPWKDDANRYGTNDFRSTKRNILEASLARRDGGGLRVLSDGSQHVRAWVDAGRVRLLVADYSNEGAAPFFSEHVVPRRPLEPGSRVQGTVRLELR